MNKVSVSLRAILAVVVLATLAGCAGPTESAGQGSIAGPTPPSAEIAAPGEVTGIGTVLQEKGDEPQLCLAAVAESYPPQCSGPPIVGWDWAGVDGSESASGVTWGAYAVQGTWDGTEFTVTQPPVMLALYDAMADPDPRLDPANAGHTAEAELLEVADELSTEPWAVGGGPMNGYVFVNVIYDDGQVQRYVDEVYGPDVVVVHSLLRDIG